MNLTKLATCAMLIMASMAANAQEVKLSGTILGSNATQAKNAFDGKTSTYFQGEYYTASPQSLYYGRNWVGLDLGEAHVITKVGIAARLNYESSCLFAVVQGANKADFSDALPITMLKTQPTIGTTAYLDVDVSRGFRYVRVVATNSRGYFSEIEFYGTPGEGDDTKFYQITNLPTVSFNTPGMAQIKSKDDKHPGSFVAIISQNGTNLLVDSLAQMKGRGNGSWTFNKKPFQIKFNKKQQPLDAPAKAKKWTLINNYGDRTLMRNKVAFDISREAGMKYTPYCTFVDVIYNGEYEGAYQLCDQVEVNPGRVEVTEMTPEDIAGEELSGGYFIEIDAYANQEISWFKSNKGIPVTIKSPKDDEIVSLQSAYIKDFFNKMETALWSSNFTDPETGYRKYLDLESFLRYFIVCELDGNLDSFWSTYMWMDRGDNILHVGPVWDVDLGFQNYGSPNPVNNLSDFLYTHNDASKADGMEAFVSRIIKQDAGAKEQLSETWSRLRKYGNFNYEYFEQRIDEYVATLAESQTLNFQRWPILNMSVQKNQKIFGSYEGEINNLKTFLEGRFTKLDQLIGLRDVAAIDDIAQDEDSNAPSELFDLQGRRVDSTSPMPGIYIRRTGSKAEKIVVR